MLDEEEKGRLEQLLHAINHDVRSPLANIRSATSILLQDISDPLTDDQRTFVEIIERATIQLLDQSIRLMLINHLAFAQVNLKPTQLSELLANIKKEIKNNYDIDTVELITDSDPLLNCQIHTLSAALALLAAGDTKHQPDTPSTASPTIHLQTQGDQLCFTIHSLMPAHETADNLIGLTREIVQQHCGKLEVSQDNTHMQFTFCLPLLKPEEL